VQLFCTLWLYSSKPLSVKVKQTQFAIKLCYKKSVLMPLHSTFSCEEKFRQEGQEITLCFRWWCIDREQWWIHSLWLPLLEEIPSSRCNSEAWKIALFRITRSILENSTNPAFVCEIYFILCQMLATHDTSIFLIHLMKPNALFCWNKQISSVNFWIKKKKTQ